MAEQPLAIARAAETARGLDPAALPGLRTRMRWTLFAISALGSTGYIAAITVGTLVAAGSTATRRSAGCRRRRPPSARRRPPGSSPD